MVREAKITFGPDQCLLLSVITMLPYQVHPSRSDDPLSLVNHPFSAEANTRMRTG